MRKTIIALTVASALALGACQSKPADQVEDQAEAKADAIDAVAKAETACKPQLDTELAGMTPTMFFSRPLAALPGVDAALDAYMGTPVTGYDRPIFLGAGLLDTDVPAKSSLVLYDQLTTNNQDVTLRIYPDEDHSGTVLASMPDTTPFLRHMFESQD